jgi:hypothetical protein
MSFDVAEQPAPVVTVKLNVHGLPLIANVKSLPSRVIDASEELLKSFHAIEAPAPAPVVSAESTTLLLPSLQRFVGPLAVTTAVGGAGLIVTTYESDCVQLLPSETVTLYVPLEAAVIVAVVSEVDHK